MYCKNCGKEFDNDAAVCPHCGAAVDKHELEPAPTRNKLAVVGFVLSFFVALAGLICSCIALKQCRETKQDGRGLAIAGIIISAIVIGISFIIGIIEGSALIAAFSSYLS